MIIILSPSKTLDSIKVKEQPNATQPNFLAQSEIIVERLRRLTIDDLKELMGISPTLARLNFERYLKWQLPFDEKNSHPALLTFKGDVYEGIDVKDFTKDDLAFAQQTVRILSGLYGVLKPLDLMQPYRLEMGTKIEINKDSNLYEFWQKTLTDHFNKLLASDTENTLVNLASNEYSKAINIKKLKGNVITPVFKEQKGNELKTIAIFAKRARGLMTRFAIKNRLDKVEHLKTFAEEGYVFSPLQTKGSTWVFVR
ncbi:MAG: peroxide stress protein YaaA [Tenuifilaceae bacterium]|jgi:cytoplasmic iron level regulating protein YaaA (DUF328/UPF0246 family)|nr:peroxide stress protein YaaA [Tenuifilaceae bacterium]